MQGVSTAMIGALLIFIFPLIGVLAICLGIWHESKKKVEKRGRGGNISCFLP
jgi:hypothetical protein